MSGLEVLNRAGRLSLPGSEGAIARRDVARVGPPIRVLHVCETLPGGIASYLDEILPYQLAQFGRGCVKVLGPSDQFQHLTRLEAGAFAGYRRTGRDPASILRLATEVRRQLDVHRPDILHLHSSIAGAVGRLVAAVTGFEGRVVYCAHGWAIDPMRRSRAQPLFRMLEQLLHPAADAIVNISPHEEIFLPRAWRRGGRVHLIRSGIGEANPLPAVDSPGGERCWRLLFVGRTDRQKGFDLLVPEMARLMGEAHLTVVGGSIVDTCGALPGAANISLLGWRPRAEIAERMLEADFVVMPSRWEGMPLVALEAMRAGRPVIASNQGAFPHIIDDGRTGLLVDIASPGFLARALAGLSRDQTRAMGAEARRQFERHFTASDMNRRLVALYEGLRAAPARRRGLRRLQRRQAA